MTTYYSVEQRSEDWHALRRYRITGSEIPVIMRSPERALREHVRKVLGLPGFQGNDATRYGAEAEPVARDWYELTRNVTVRQVGFAASDDDPRLGCSPDGITNFQGGEAVVEFKCPYTGDLPEEPKPDHVKQVQWNTGICKLDTGLLVYWTPEGSAVFPVPADPAWFEKAVAAAQDLLAEAEPILKDQATALAWLTAQEAQIGLRSDREWAEAAQAYLDAKAAQAAAEAATEAAKAALLALAGDKPAAGAGVKLAWVERQGQVDWPKIARKHGISVDEIEAARKKSTTYARITED
jgi:hypothetical protein